MPGSPLAKTISRRSMVTRKKGHSSYISRSVARPPPASLCCMACLNAAPKPSHTGRWNRVCVHAKIHGMARSDSMPPPGFRFDGRLPMFIRPYSVSGVAARKYSTKRGSWNTMERYSSVATVAMSSSRRRHSGFGDTGGFMPCSRVAAVNLCSVRKQRFSSPNDFSMTSPWTVTRSEPLTVFGGWDRMARWLGPPPRPTVPPRPWKMVSFTPCRSATPTISSWALYSCHAADSRPASLPESEYPIMISCFPSIRSLYQSTEKRSSMVARAC
ncbi:unknown protein [Oryza sativa Japonica Group]|uniref:Os01g0208800 protein n=2 Tax=Oryza sativa subsp. japonica TaxID=39947 RepID=Q0JPQ5_ORYSJ|nr:hypothetical protein EE612_000973 [Oryza sativa]BAD73102.1 unknown protein [Oryza sativa Japonica Group]BAF04273.1 Os01g0208800 [Oryza sativa Japonica Group]BAS70965.1 Os01g0208800 [Oryza sativa Japonica Group]|eukprot:NP_001042359.1 Os01g0208800 [Oryza sativa Japonica Group]